MPGINWNCYTKEQGCTNTTSCTYKTEFWVVARKTFRIVNAVLFLTCKNVYQFKHIKKKVTDNRSTGHSRIVGPKNGICFTLSFWHQDFWKYGGHLGYTYNCQAWSPFIVQQKHYTNKAYRYKVLGCLYGKDIWRRERQCEHVLE